MAISANLFLDRLAERDLLDDKVIASLRKQVAARHITSTQIAKTLIEKGHLTTFLAKKLLAEEDPSSGGAASVTTLESSGARKQATPSSAAKAPTESSKTVSSKTINDDLDLALSNSEVVDLVLVDDSSTGGGGAGGAKEPTFKLTPVPQPPPKAPEKFDIFSGASKSPTAPTPPTPPLSPPVSSPPVGPPASGAPTQVEPVKGTFAPLGPAPKETWRGVPEGSGSHSVRQTSGPAPGGFTSSGYASSPPAAPPGSLTPSDDLLTPVDLLNDPLVTGAGMSGAASASPGLLQETKTKGVFVEKKGKGNRWEGFWIIGVGGLLIASVIAGVFILFVLKKGDATEMFQIAEDSYQSEQYAQAIEHYRRFLKSFPDDPNASRARVRIGIATLRQSLGGARDFQRPLTVAGEVLPTIESEASFEDGRAELATLLPDIAAGFAAQGQASKEIADKEKFADLAMKAMDLVNESKYIPTRLREPQQARIDGILEDVALVRREIQREKDFAAALAAMKDATEKGETAQAYQVRRELLKKYAGLDSHPLMRAAVLAIAEAERSLVKLVNEKKEPEGIAPASPSKTVVLSDHSSPGGEPDVPGVEGRAAVVLAPGAVIGLDATTGRVLWRRTVDPATAIQPQPVAAAAGADVLAADSGSEDSGSEDGGRHELLRLGGLDGNVVWRLPIGEPFISPVIHREKIYLATLAGGWWEIDLKTGVSARRLQFSQPLAAGPGVDASRGVIYQTGSHSNLYVLSQGGLACDDVFYLGHKTGAVTMPPLVAAGLVLVADNASAAGCVLHVLAPDEKEGKLTPAQAAIRLDGHVVTPMTMYGSRVLLNTDRGAIRIFEVDPNRKDQPLSVTAQFNAASPERAIAYSVALEGRLWTADQRLARYDVQLTRGELSRKSVIDNRSVYVAPLRSIGQAFVHVRRRLGVPGLVATAAHIDDGRVLWETELNSPLAGAPIASGEKLAAVSARGKLFEVPRADLESGRFQTPAKSVEPKAGVVFERTLALGGERWAFVGSGARDFAVYNASGDFRLIAPKSAAPGDFGGDAIAYAGGVLSPCKLGQVFLIDPATGADMALPFQPALAASEEVAWRRPVAIGPNGEEFVIADNRRRMYRVGMNQQPAKQLAELKAVDLDREIVSPLAAAQDTVYGVVRDAAFDRLVAYSLPDLKPVQEWELSGRVVWGPEAAGAAVLIVTDGNTLACFGPSAQRLWQKEWKHGALAGPPAQTADALWLAAKNGRLVKIAAASGDELASLELGSLGSGPIVFGDRLVAAGAEGLLHVINPADVQATAAGQ